MANKIYNLDETALLFADTAQVEDAALTLSALAAGAGRISARYDRGTAAKTTRYRWRATIQLATAGTIGEAFDIYASTSDGTSPDGEEGTADAALSSVNKLKNLIYLGSIITDTVSTNTNITASGEIEISERYLSIVVWNGTTDALRTDTSVHHVTLTPVAPQIQ